MKNIYFVVLFFLIVLIIVCVNRVIETDYESKNNCKFETVMTTTDTPERVCLSRRQERGED